MTVTKDGLRRLAARAAASGLISRVAPYLGRRGLMPWRLLRHLPAPECVSVVLHPCAEFRYFPTQGDGVDRQLHWVGLRRSSEAATLLPFARLAAAAHGVVDIGANVGLYSLVALAANPNSLVYAFEPVPQTAERLRQNLRLNHWEDRCHVEQVALADEVGTASLHVPHGHLPTSASLHPDGFRHLPGSIIEVPVARIDDYLRDLDSIDLVKIDVEGFEDAVLRGAPRLLRQRPTIILECHPDGPADALDSLLLGAGYQIYRLIPDNPRPVDRIRAEVGAGHRNFLCIGAGRQDVVDLVLSSEPGERHF